MITLREALQAIADECNKHETCKGCPFYVIDDVFGNHYCSITREGDVPGEWKIEQMINS